MTRRVAQSVVAGVAVLATAAFTLGGWAIITVEDLPESAVAGEPLTTANRVDPWVRSLHRGPESTERGAYHRGGGINGGRRTPGPGGDSARAARARPAIPHRCACAAPLRPSPPCRAATAEVPRRSGPRF